MQETNNVSENPSPPPPPPPPPQHNRRPKTREVSSRFMTPSISSTQRRQQRDDSDDENSECSFPIGYSFQKKPQQQRSVKLFKETTNRVFDNIPNPNSNSSSYHPSKQPSSRPDTPTHTMSVSSRYRQTPHHQQHHRSINARSSAASKLIQSSGMSSSRGNSNSRDDIDIHCSTQSLPELRSETGDVLMQQPKVPTGSVAEKYGNNLSRSVSLSSSGIDRVKVGGLPPVPPQYVKSAADTRKGKKGGHQDDVTSLKLLHNRYLQWRFANAKAENAMKVQQKECEVCYLHLVPKSGLQIKLQFLLVVFWCILSCVAACEYIDR